MRANSGCFGVAIGLALQGLGKSFISVNLLFDESPGIFKKFAAFSRARPAKAAWGIDLGSHGLKAVRLQVDERNDRVVIDQCKLIEHNKPAGRFIDDEELSRCQKATLASWVEQKQLGADRVCINLPSRNALHRTIDVPPLKSTQFDDAMKLEARHQFPFSLDQLTWGYQRLGQGAASSEVYTKKAPDDTASPTHETRSLFVGAKNELVRERMAMFTEMKIQPLVVQSEAVAACNFLAYESAIGDLTGKASTGGSRPLAAEALVDIGGCGANVIVRSSDLLWVTTMSVGGDKLTKALATHLDITFDQAEQVKRNPAKARRVCAVYEAIDPLFEELSAEMERSLKLFANAHKDHKVVRIVGLGGGFQMHGIFTTFRKATATGPSSSEDLTR